MSVLDIKSWQLFIILVAPLLAVNQFEADQFLEIEIGLSLLTYFFIYSWYALLGLELSSTLSKKFTLSRFVLLFSCFYVFLSLTLSKLSVFAPVNSIGDAPWYVLLILIVFFLSYGYIIFFVGNLLIRYAGNELNSKLGKAGIAWVFILLFVFPIGVWFIQPILNEKEGQ
jgi:hypothetical protein